MANDIDRALSALSVLDPGTNRDTWVRVAMAAKDAGLTLQDFTEWSSNAPNFGSDKECATVWNSVKPGAVTEASLYGMAHRMGWKDPGKSAYRAIAAHAVRQRPTMWKQAPERVLKPAIAPSVQAVALWEACRPATAEHPYIIAKGGRPDGLRVVPSISGVRIAGQSVADWLAVPVLSVDGELRTLQLIPPPGRGGKLNLPGHAFGDGYFVVGEIAEAARIFIVEGIGQGWSCWQATGDATAVAFGAGRFAAVAEALRKRVPGACLVCVPDRGKEDEAEAVARTSGGQVARLPEDRPRNYDANDYARDYGADELAQLLDNAKAPETRYKLKAAADLINAPPLKWTVRGVLPAEGLACLFGASGSGKSFLALDLCAAIASGSRWFGYKVIAAPVVYVALEGESGFSQRVKAWQAHHFTDVPERVRFVMQAFDLRNSDDLQAMADAVIVSGGAGGLLVIDTLNRAASGADENTSRDMGEIIDAAKSLQARFGGLVLMIHHSGKDQSRGLRGHSSLIAALDASIEVVKLDSRREWRAAKVKDGTDDTAHSFRLHIVDIGCHEDGERITSCVVVPDEGGREFRLALAPKSGNQKIAFDGLGEILQREGVVKPPNAPPSLPAGCPAVPVEDAIATIRQRLVCDAKRKTERTQQALTALHARGLIGIEAGWLWKH